MPISTSAMAAGPPSRFGEGVSVARSPWGLRQYRALPGGSDRGVRHDGDGGGLRRRPRGSRRDHGQLRGSRARGGGGDRQRWRRRRAGPRFGVDVLVLDLSLSDGSGERTLEALNAEGTGVAVVVFTAYASDPWRLLRLGRPGGGREARLRAPRRACSRAIGDVRSTPSVPPDERRLASREVADAPTDVALAGRRELPPRPHPLAARHGGRRRRPRGHRRRSRGARGRRRPAAHRRLPPRRRRHAARRAPRPGPAPRGAGDRRLRRAPPGRRRPRGRGRVVAPHRRAADAPRCPAR